MKSLVCIRIESIADTQSRRILVRYEDSFEPSVNTENKYHADPGLCSR